jgi:hypothetical protein
VSGGGIGCLSRGGGPGRLGGDGPLSQLLAAIEYAEGVFYTLGYGK